jgi:hypothetical protein
MSFSPHIINAIFFGSFAKQLRKMTIVPVMFVYPRFAGVEQRHSLLLIVVKIHIWGLC